MNSFLNLMNSILGHVINVSNNKFSLFFIIINYSNETNIEILEKFIKFL